MGSLPPHSVDAAGDSHAELRLLAVLAPLGVLDPGAQRRLGLHLLSSCAVCERAIEDAWSALDVLALATPLLPPSPEGRARLRARALRAPRVGFLPHGGR